MFSQRHFTNSKDPEEHHRDLSKPQLSSRSDHSKQRCGVTRPVQRGSQVGSLPAADAEERRDSVHSQTSTASISPRKYTKLYIYSRIFSLYSHELDPSAPHVAVTSWEPRHQTALNRPLARTSATQYVRIPGSPLLARRGKPYSRLTSRERKHLPPPAATYTSSIIPGSNLRPHQRLNFDSHGIKSNTIAWNSPEATTGIYQGKEKPVSN
jgi:hypothetical protein